MVRACRRVGLVVSRIRTARQHGTDRSKAAAGRHEASSERMRTPCRTALHGKRNPPTALQTGDDMGALSLRLRTQDMSQNMWFSDVLRRRSSCGCVSLFLRVATARASGALCTPLLVYERLSAGLCGQGAEAGTQGLGGYPPAGALGGSLRGVVILCGLFMGTSWLMG